MKARADFSSREPRESREATQSRRTFLKHTGGGLSFVLVFGPAGVTLRGPVDGREADGLPGADGRPAAEHAFGAWVRIATDGQVLIYNPAAEMGQGSMTALPVILAEEMDADWDRVRIEHSPVEPSVYGRSWGGRGPGGTMMTVGSMAVRGYFTNLRLAGAQIRRVLLDNVAREWSVPAGELTTEPGVVVHASSGRRISYGEVAAFARVPSELPEVGEAELKSPDDFRLIGHSVPRHDIPAKTDGSARYGMDVRVPGMLYGMIVRSPVHEGRPASFNEAEVRAQPGVVGTVTLDYGVGVIGETVEAVFGARDVMNIEWAGGAAAEGFDSVPALESYADIAGPDGAPGRTISESGDAAAALEGAARRYEADFYNDYAYHAQMEPLNAVAAVNEAGDGAEVWAGTQAADGARSAVASTLGVPVERVTFHPCYLGGGFGRRSMSDYVVEAVHLSRAVRRPVKLIWTREDDVQYGAFRPQSLQRMTGGVDADGDLTAWTHCVVGDGGGLLSSGIEIPHYGVPNQHIESRGPATACAPSTGGPSGTAPTSSPSRPSSTTSPAANPSTPTSSGARSCGTRRAPWPYSTRSPRWPAGARVRRVDARGGSPSRNEADRSRPAWPRSRWTRPAAASACTVSGAPSTAASSCSRTTPAPSSRAASSPASAARCSSGSPSGTAGSSSPTTTTTRSCACPTCPKSTCASSLPANPPWDSENRARRSRAARWRTPSRP